MSLQISSRKDGFKPRFLWTSLYLAVFFLYSVLNLFSLQFLFLMFHCSNAAAISLLVSRVVFLCWFLTVAFYFTSSVFLPVLVAIFLSFFICCHTFFALPATPRHIFVALIQGHKAVPRFFCASISKMFLRRRFIVSVFLSTSFYCPVFFSIPSAQFIRCHWFIIGFLWHMFITQLLSPVPRV